MKERSLEQDALDSLLQCLQKVPFLQVEQVINKDSNTELDLQVWVRVQERRKLLILEVKSSGQPRIARMASYVLNQQVMEKTDAYGIFFAPFISPESGQLCEEAGIGYLDLAGNCLLSFNTIYVRQAGAPNPNIVKRDLRSMYSPKAERILRALLGEPARAWKLTDLAQSVEVSLGQVANVKKLLLDREWVSSPRGGIQLIQPAALMDEWAGVYNFRRNKVLEYYALSELPEIEAQLAQTCLQLGSRYALTGFSSAARYAPAVRYQKASAYVQGDVDSLVNALKWKPVTSGANIRLLIPYDQGVFYDTQDIDGIENASPLQTYLDLQAGRGRGQEAAVSLRRKMETSW